MIFLLRILLLMVVLAPAWAGNSIAILDRYALVIEHGAVAPSHRLALVLAYFEDSWTPETIRSAVRKGAQILAQCGVEIAKAELVRLDAPAFEAEAVGRGNSATRPELKDTVWVARGARDLEIVLAHELVHVLMDSGDHSDEARNLMREDTAPGNTRLDDAQYSWLRATATANGLLRPVR